MPAGLIPPLSFSAGGGKSSAGLTSDMDFDNSGMVVNFGPALTASGNVSTWLLVGALALAGLWLYRRKG